MASITPIQAFELGADAAYLSKRPLPIAPDGHYDWENQADANTSPQAHAGVTNLVNTVIHICRIPRVELTNFLDREDRIEDCHPRPPRSGGPPCRSFLPPAADFTKQGAFLDTALHPDAVDDRKGAVSILYQYPRRCVVNPAHDIVRGWTHSPIKYPF